MNVSGNVTDSRAETVPSRVLAYHQRMSGFVYFVTDGEAVKIGFSGAPDGRVADLQISTPRELKPLAKFPGTMADEQAVHALFQDLRIRGEWFRPDQRITDFIARLEGPAPAAQFPEKGFRQWADRACVEWPGELQVKAAYAAYAIEGKAFAPANAVSNFASAYAEWTWLRRPLAQR